MSLSNVAIILVRPSEAGNVGAAARAMKNFGLSDLRLVNPQLNFKEHDDRWMSVGAYELIEQAKVFSSLSEALEDIAQATATTSGRDRAIQSVDFSQACKLSVDSAKRVKVAWVFGNERNGLTGNELDRCHHAATIPTEPEFPVLNLAQSIAIVSYECSRHRNAQALGQAEQVDSPSGRDDDKLFSHVSSLLKRIEFTRDFNHELIVTELRSAYQRSRVSIREYGLLNGIVRRLLDRLA